MKLADLFNEDNRYKTAMAISGLGSVLQGKSAAPMMQNMMMMDLQKQESEQEQQEKARQQQARQQANQRLQSLFGGGGQTAGGFNSAEPVSMPNENQMIGAETMAALGTESYTPGDKESFVKAMMPHAMRVSQQTGLDPRLVIAQAAQETGWGRSAPNNNFFGIKSHGRDNGARLSTRESIDGQNVQIQDSFRQYGGMGESADDYARFLQNNPRYQEMLSAPDLQSQVRALGQSGYATDPNYAQSVGSIAQSIGAQGGDRRMAQAGGQTRTDAIDPARAMMILNNPNVSDQAKSYIVSRLKAQNAAPSDDRTALRQNVEWIMSQNPGMPFEDALQTARSGVNVNVENNTGPQGIDYGDPQPGLVWQRDQNGQVVMDDRGAPIAVPYKGGSVFRDQKAAAQEQAAAAAQGNERDRQKRIKMGTTLRSMSSNISEIEDGGWPVLGPIGRVSSMIPGTAASNFDVNTAQITDQAALDEISEMRQNSPTGGAVGSLTDGERVALGQARTGISAAQSEEAYIDAIKNYRQVMLDIAFKGSDWRIDDETGEVVVTPKAGFQGNVPSGLSPEEWEAMPEEDRALWR